jgi:hypothetical protein
VASDNGTKGKVGIAAHLHKQWINTSTGREIHDKQVKEMKEKYPPKAKRVK